MPAGEPPSLNREFRAETLPSGFTEASRAVSFEAAPQTAGGLLLTGLLPVSANGGLMAITETGTNLTMKTCRLGAKIVSPSEPPFSAGWQVWRLPVEPSAQPTEFELRTTAGLNASQAEQDCRIYFIPKP